MTDTQANLRFPCGFCAGHYIVPGPDHITANKVFYVLHSLPPCEQFNRQDPLDFLVACRKRRERECGGDN